MVNVIAQKLQWKAERDTIKVNVQTCLSTQTEHCSVCVLKQVPSLTQLQSHFSLTEYNHADFHARARGQVSP